MLGKFQRLELVLKQEVMSSTENGEPSHIDDTVIEEQAPKLKKPTLYQVILLNDDFTPMDFVVDVLQLFFYMDADKATQIMLNIHTKGKGVCGVFTKDVAETKAMQVNEFSRENQHPLMCEIEPIDNDDDNQ